MNPPKSVKMPSDRHAHSVVTPPNAGAADRTIASVREVRDLLDRLEESLKNLPHSAESEGLVDAVIRLRGWMNRVLPE